jgi:hypothetical protein
MNFLCADSIQCQEKPLNGPALAEGFALLGNQTRRVSNAGEGLRSFTLDTDSHAYGPGLRIALPASPDRISSRAAV